jgi:spermidine/putrescine ABC transporter ATP-binding subunit
VDIGAAIEVERLNKRYGGFVAVDDLSLTVKAGEFVTLLGSSGSGKTTTLMAIAGFVAPDSGRISIDGRDISRLAPERRNLGVVFQSYALFPHLNVFENIAFPLRLRGMAQAEIGRCVSRILDLVSLDSFRDRRVPELSGGQQQRVALARALVFEPPVLLMDEPLGALDRKLRDQMQTEIKRIQRELGVTVLYVTHDQEEALALSDRIAIMADGRIQQLGTPDEVYERPVSAFVASFLGESNLMPVRLLGTEGSYVRLRCLESDGEQTLLGCAEQLPDGKNAIAMVRPEAIHIVGPDGDGYENRLDGEIELREFLGSSVRLSVRSRYGRLIVRTSRMAAGASLESGAPIYLGWKPEDVIVFDDPSARSPQQPASW